MISDSIALLLGALIGLALVLQVAASHGAVLP